MTAARSTSLQLAALILISVALLVLTQVGAEPLISTLEAVSCVSLAWSVWLLARNHPAGWWVGLVGVAGYAVVFYRVQLYAEVGLQGVYFVTSLQAIWIWLRGGEDHTERPVGTVAPRWLLASAGALVLGTLALMLILTQLRGAFPLVDALTTVLSLIAHVYLMLRYVESWYLWVAVDTIYVPLYAARGLYLTSGLYAVFWLMALNGLFTFERLRREQQAAGARSAAGGKPAAGAKP